MHTTSICALFAAVIVALTSVLSALECAVAAEPKSLAAESLVVAESSAEAATTYKRDGKCYRYLPNIGRAYEISCDSDEDNPPAKRPAKESEPRPAPPSSEQEPPSAPRILLPEKGSVLRADLMNAARPVFEREIGGTVVFSTRRLAVYGDWAFGDVHPLRPNGSEIDWAQTKFGSALKSGAFQKDSSFFLLKRSAGGWTVVETSIGPTDVTWDWWRQQYKLPSELFSP